MTRLYFPYLNASLSPAVSEKWEQATSYYRYLLALAPQGTSFYSRYVSGSGVSNTDVFVAQFISPRLAAQTISGTVKGYLRALESSELLDAHRAMVIKVVSDDGSVVRGTLLEHFPTSATEFATAVTNREFPPASTALSSVVCQAGDRLVIEVGFRQLGPYANYTAGISVGDSGAQLSPAGAPTVALAGTGAGNLSAGDYYYKVTFYNARGETQAGTLSSVVTVVNPATDGKVALSAIPTGGAGTTGRKIYRTVAGGSVFKLVTTIADNTTLTYEDDVADASLGAVVPTLNTTGDLPENETETGNYNGWIDFSATLSFLEGAVPEVVSEEGAGGFVLAGQPTLEVNEPVTKTVTGGLVLAGEGTLSITRPTPTKEVAEGGFVFGGSPVLKVVQPTVHAHTGAGGLALGGQATLVFKGKDAIPTYSYVGWGGFVLAGAPTAQKTTPKTIQIVAAGGFRFAGPLQIPEVTVTRPSLISGTKVSVVGQGGFILGEAEARLTVTYPDILVVEEAAIPLVLGGEPGLVVIRPTTIEVLGEGGLVLAEEPIPEEACDTWVLSGAGKEPSLYTGFPFNSYAIIQNKPYAAGNDGIYRLEGATDGGSQIRPGLRVRQTNFGYDGPKRLRSVYLNDGNEAAEVRVETRFEDENGAMTTKSGYFLKTRGGWKISRDLRGSEFVIDVASFTKLSHFEVIPLVLAKR